MSKHGLVRSRISSLLSIIAMVATGLSVSTLVAPVASAAPGPIAAPGVTADALPTAQINGVAWVQRVVGNTVFVGGQFTNARPAGAAPGTAQVARNNLMAYNLTTGVMTNFAPNLNGQVKAMAVSPDGSRLYVGGSFTTVNGANRYRLVAFNTATGAQITTWAPPSVNATVNSIVATNTTVYVGGVFGIAGGQTRSRLAAFSATNGALTGWAPSADATVNALVMTPDGGIVVGGAFLNINGASSYGLGKVSQSDGTKLSWDPSGAGHTVANAGVNSAILSLATDGNAVYGTGYHYGSGGNLEGTFSANPATGALNWVVNCHGDTYDAAAVGGAIYTVSHAHYCTPVGGFPQSDPWAINMRRSLAFTTAATGTNSRDEWGYYNWENAPSPSMLNWFPVLAAGTFTGKTQAAWSVAGNGDYVVLGGEFPSVNGKAQQGLVRFAVKPIAPSKEGPEYSGASFPPSIVSIPGGARVAWQANSDKDDNTLTYKVTRDGTTVYQSSAKSTFWNRPTMGFIDKNLTAGVTYKYRLSATDGSGNTVQSDNVSYVAAGGGTSSAYATKVVADGAAPYWPMNEASGTVLFDNGGFNDADAGSGITRGITPGAVTGDTASGFNGSTSAANRIAQAGPDTFTAQAWINTTSTTGGKILGFGGSQTGNSGSYDRHVYMDNAGQIFFGVYPNAVRTVNSDPGYNDGRWHQVTVSLGSDGMKLYIDAKLVAQRADVSWGQAYSGFWRVGGDNIGGWPNQPSSSYFSGAIDEVAIYPTVLSRATIDAQWVASGRTSTLPAPANQAPTASFTASATSPLTAGVNATGSTDPDGTIASYSWNWGDGSPTGTGVTATHSYATAGTHTITLTVTDNGGLTATSSKSVTVAAAPVNQAPVASFTVIPSQLTANFDGTGSSDADGTVVGYSWDFGDSETGSGATPSHVYGSAGTYTVKLTVTDNAGATNSSSQPVQVVAPPVNVKPVASFTSDVNGLTANLTSTSTDSDGEIVSYEWNFGDGQTGTEASVAHKYAAAGSYTVRLTVTDDDGGSTSVTKSVTVSAPAAGNVAPIAAFTSAANGLAVAFDGTGSTDTDGTVSAYLWDFGDGTTDPVTTSSASHSYATAGTYAVKLTVTDNAGAMNSVTKNITVSAPAPIALVSDTFSRTLASGFGSSESGGAWTITGGAGNFSVGGGTGKIKMAAAGAGPSATLNAVSVPDVDLTLDVALDKAATGGGTQVSTAVRKVGSSEYRTTAKFLAGGSVELRVVKIVNGTSTTLRSVTVPGLTYSAKDVLTIRFQAVGTSSVALNAKVWKTGTIEPTSWQTSATDASGTLSTTGGVAIYPYLSGSATAGAVVATLDNLKVVAVGP